MKDRWPHLDDLLDRAFAQNAPKTADNADVVVELRKLGYREKELVSTRFTRDYSLPPKGAGASRRRDAHSSPRRERRDRNAEACLDGW